MFTIFIFFLSENNHQTEPNTQNFNYGENIFIFLSNLSILICQKALQYLRRLSQLVCVRTRSFIFRLYHPPSRTSRLPTEEALCTSRAPSTLTNCTTSVFQREHAAIVTVYTARDTSPCVQVNIRVRRHLNSPSRQHRTLPTLLPSLASTHSVIVSQSPVLYEVYLRAVQCCFLIDR